MASFSFEAFIPLLNRINAAIERDCGLPISISLALPESIPTHLIDAEHATRFTCGRIDHAALLGTAPPDKLASAELIQETRPAITRKL